MYVANIHEDVFESAELVKSGAFADINKLLKANEQIMHICRCCNGHVNERRHTWRSNIFAWGHNFDITSMETTVVANATRPSWKPGYLHVDIYNVDSILFTESRPQSTTRGRYESTIRPATGLRPVCGQRGFEAPLCFRELLLIW